MTMWNADSRWEEENWCSDAPNKTKGRLTEKWTPTLDEAFGETGTKGRIGEEFLLKVFKSWGWYTKHHEDDKKAQLEGRDIEFRKPTWSRYYSCDVKNNLWDNGRFRVYKEWLFKVKCDRIFHVNPETGWVIWYPVDLMKEMYDNSKQYMEINARDKSSRPDFIKMVKYK